jgi:hypothetical protein
MKKLLSIIIMVLPLFVSASITDPLYDFDYARVGIKGIYLAGGPIINMDNAMFDQTGKKIESVIVEDKLAKLDYSYKTQNIWIPLKLGYSFDEQYSIGVIVPMARLSQTETISGIETLESNTAFGNIWVWAKGNYLSNNGFILAPRLGIKLPYASYTYENYMQDSINHPESDPKAVTGDKSFAIDASSAFAFRPEANPLRLDGQLALRYSLEGTYTLDFGDTLGSFNLKDNPGLFLNCSLMPGLAWGSNNNQESYLIADYTMMLFTGTRQSIFFNEYSSEILVYDIVSKGSKLLSIGLKHDWIPSTNNCFELKFLYDVLAYAPQHSYTIYGHFTESGSIPAGMSIGVGYFGYIPM